MCERKTHRLFQFTSEMQLHLWPITAFLIKPWSLHVFLSHLQEMKCIIVRSSLPSREIHHLGIYQNDGKCSRVVAYPVQDKVELKATSRYTSSTNPAVLPPPDCGIFCVARFLFTRSSLPSTLTESAQSSSSSCCSGLASMFESQGYTSAFVNQLFLIITMGIS